MIWNENKTSVLKWAFLFFILIIHSQILFGQSRQVKVGAISMEATHRFDSPLDTKIKQVKPLLVEAGNLNLDVVALPEAYFRGKSAAVDYQYLDDSVVLDSMKVFAKENNINIIFNVYEREEAKLYNTAVLVNRNGDYIGKYRKVNLPPEESSITPGNAYPVFDLDFGKVGILICWDGWFTEPAKTLADKGAEIIIIPTWCNIQRNLNTIAAENGVPVSYAILRVNCGTGAEDLPSSVFDHHGDPVFEDHHVGLNKIAIGTVTLGGYFNLALNRPVQAFSGTDPLYPAANAVDGQYSTERDAPEEKQTFWKASSLPQWIEIDLGDDYDIDRVSIAQFNTGEYEYTIEGKTTGSEYRVLSDSVTHYETFLEHGIAGSEILSSRFEKKNVRYVRLTVNSASQSDVTINEIKIFGYNDFPAGIGEKNNLKPEGFEIFQNYPNPFNSETVIKYVLPEKSDVKVTLYNSQGRVVKYLLSGNFSAGDYSVKWDGTGCSGQVVSSGLYICGMECKSISGHRVVDFRKMVFIK
ncbi:discoidin domain-containing protein [candidate division KSB1 bacterium]|nr:discoidin domain-containing protein [candidate division KSB1 bacterium]